MMLILLRAFAFDPVVEDLGDGEIDWTNLRLIAGADGASATGVLASIEAMEGDARAKLGPKMLDLCRKIRISSRQYASDLLEAHDAVSDRLDDNKSIFEVFESQYFTSGSVHIEAALPIHAWLRPALTHLAQGVERPAAAAGVTGVVVDARGLKVAPAVAPRLREAGGAVIYSVETLSEYAASLRPPVVYVHDPADPVAVKRAGAEPLFVRASAIVEETDLVLDELDAPRVTEAAALTDFLLHGNVVIVVDP